MKKEPHLLLRRVSYLKSLFLMTCLLIIATSTLGTFIKYYKISQLIHTQIIAN